MIYKATRLWPAGRIPVANGPISEVSERNLKLSAIDIMVNKSKLTRQVFEATISTGGNPRCVADIEEVVVTSTGQGGWCGEGDTLKIDVANLNQKNDALEKRNDALEIRVGLLFAIDVISEVIAVVYDRIEFKHDGQFVCGYGDVHRLCRQYSESTGYMSALNKALY